MYAEAQQTCTGLSSVAETLDTMSNPVLKGPTPHCVSHCHYPCYHD